ncbi:MAG: hypothetical protein QXT27_08260 [Pyrobaculum sp.]
MIYIWRVLKELYEKDEIVKALARMAEFMTETKGGYMFAGSVAGRIKEEVTLDGKMIEVYVITANSIKAIEIAKILGVPTCIACCAECENRI